MTRDKALAVFDALVVRGYACTLTVYHGETQGALGSPTREPLYHVEFGPHDRSRSSFTRVDLERLAAIADDTGAALELFGGEGSWSGRFLHL